MEDNFIQERITALRLKKGVSARDMSLSLGQCESYINTIENKKSLPSMQVFLYICEYFEITPMEFFDVENNNPVILKEVIHDLKRLDDHLLSPLAVLAKELAAKKK